MNESLKTYIERVAEEFSLISDKRTEVLDEIRDYIVEEERNEGEAALIFICTHNSRRSHMGQLWAAAAATHYGVENFRSYSGGTEATAFARGALEAMKRAGFLIDRVGGRVENPQYNVQFSNQENGESIFSKKFSDAFNPTNGFAAIMTCSDADEACPHISGANARFNLPYEDPKVADGTPREEEVYDRRCREIAREMIYIFHYI